MRRWLGATLLLPAGCSWLVDAAGLTGTPKDADADGGRVTVEEAGSRDALVDADSADALDTGADRGAGVRSGLVGEWLFDRGTAADTSGHGHDGALFGAGAIEDGGVRGGALFTHDGGGMMVAALGLAAFPPSGTLAMWIKSAIPANDNALRGLFDDWDDARNHLYLRKTVGTPLSLQIALQSNDGGYAWAHTFVVSSSGWVHVALTWDHADDLAIVYLGGVEAARKAGLGGFVPAQQLVDLGGAFDGAVDEARLFDRALTASEIASLP